MTAGTGTRHDVTDLEIRVQRAPDRGPGSGRVMSRVGVNGLLRPPEMSEQTSEPREVGVLDGDDVELVAREIQMRGATVPAVLFLEANRGAGSLEGLGMLFFDPVIRGVFGGDLLAARGLLADDDGIVRLIDRLEELEAEIGLDA